MSDITKTPYSLAVKAERNKHRLSVVEMTK